MDNPEQMPKTPDNGQKETFDGGQNEQAKPAEVLTPEQLAEQEAAEQEATAEIQKQSRQKDGDFGHKTVEPTLDQAGLDGKKIVGDALSEKYPQTEKSEKAESHYEDVTRINNVLGEYKTTSTTNSDFIHSELTKLKRLGSIDIKDGTWKAITVSEQENITDSWVKYSSSIAQIPRLQKEAANLLSSDNYAEDLNKFKSELRQCLNTIRDTRDELRKKTYSAAYGVRKHIDRIENEYKDMPKLEKETLVKNWQLVSDALKGAEESIITGESSLNAIIYKSGLFVPTSQKTAKTKQKPEDVTSPKPQESSQTENVNTAEPEQPVQAESVPVEPTPIAEQTAETPQTPAQETPQTSQDIKEENMEPEPISESAPAETEKPAEAKQEQPKTVEKKEWTEAKKREEINKIVEMLQKNNEFLQFGKLFTAEKQEEAKLLLAKLFRFDTKPTPELAERAKKNDEIAYAGQDGVIYLLDKVYGNERKDKDGNTVEGEYDRQAIIAHEVSHILLQRLFVDNEGKISGLAYNREDWKQLHSAVTEGKRDKLSDEFQEVLKVLDNPALEGAKESEHVQALLVKLDKVGKSGDQKEFHKLRFAIAHEIMAEKMSYFLMAKDKSSSLGMLHERITRTPEKSLREYLKIDNDEEFKSLQEAIKSGDKAKINEFAKEGSPFHKLFKENEAFYDKFTGTIGSKNPKLIAELINNTEKHGNLLDLDDDDLDMIGFGGGYTGESGSLGGQGGKGFLDMIFEFFSKMFGQG